MATWTFLEVPFCRLSFCPKYILRGSTLAHLTGDIRLSASYPPVVVYGGHPRDLEK